MAKQLVLEVSNLSLHRGGTGILHDVSWRVCGDEHWAILGANGSGKTSLLSALTGYVTPSSGEILLLGKKYGRTDWRELRKKIGLVSSSVRRLMAEDEPALESILSGKDAIIGFHGRTTSLLRRRALRILKQIKCSYLATRPWHVLSQGERQRVLIGRALMPDPKLLILDEPCAGLDPAARELFLRFIQRLGQHRNSPRIVLVTHHVEEIMPLFSHVLLLESGRVLASGKKQDVLTGKNLSRTFKVGMNLRNDYGRYTLSVRNGSDFKDSMFKQFSKG